MPEPRAGAPVDTIYAPATAPGRAAIAVLRLSGPASAHVCLCLTRRPPPPPRRATLRALHDPAGGEVLDRGLALWMPGPDSFTGEDVLELQVHGGRAVVDALLAALAELPGLRPAEPGEFTRRAFLAGRLDLTAAEGLADLVDAETRAQARQALRQMDGALARLYDGWRDRLVAALALLEAEIDFAADEDVPDRLIDQVAPEIAELGAAIQAHLADAGRGERLREGLSVAIVGPVNAGKSSLLNRIAGRDVAIVAATPGTTRDVIEVQLDLDGLPLTLLDMAGLREAGDEVEAEGVRRARARAERADLRLILFDGAHWPELDRATTAWLDHDALVAVNKADLGLPAALLVGGREALRLSCRTGAGLDRLLDRLRDAARGRLSSADRPVLTRARHRVALGEALDALKRFEAAAEGGELALLAEDLRLAARALGRITGRVVVDDLLDRIFASFCIGK